MVTNAVAQDISILRNLRQSVFQDLELAAHVQQEAADQALASDIHQAGGRHTYHLVSVHESKCSMSRIIERQPSPVR